MRADLLAKCGDPDSKESHEQEISERLGRGVQRKLFVAVEDWTYDFGPNQLQRIVTLKNGTVAYIRKGNYGYSTNAANRPWPAAIPKATSLKYAVNRAGKTRRRRSLLKDSMGG